VLAVRSVQAQKSGDSKRQALSRMSNSAGVAPLAKAKMSTGEYRMAQ
jgi:hypothetical protein